MGFVVHRHPALAHGLKKGGLSARHGAVDLVDEHHVREDGPWTKQELRSHLGEDHHTQNICQKEVAGKLHATKFQSQRPGQRKRKDGLPNAWDVLQEQVAPGQKTSQSEGCEFSLSEKHSANVVEYLYQSSV